jgi:dolichyl-phosphate beta-glucosyltransferase
VQPASTLLVIPHFNDTERLAPYLKDLQASLPRSFAILVSDDGSDGWEVQKLSQLVASLRDCTPAGGPQLRAPLLHPVNTGKGGAVFRGLMRGDNHSLLGFVDADGAVGAREIIRAESYFRQNAGRLDALFGSRVKMLGRRIERNLIRHLSGRIFATLVSVSTGLDAYDTQCGLKFLKQDAFQAIKDQWSVQGFAFDVEMCLLLNNSGKVIEEFPIDWSDQPGSKVHMLRDSVRMAWMVRQISKRSHLQSTPARKPI